MTKPLQKIKSIKWWQVFNQLPLLPFKLMPGKKPKKRSPKTYRLQLTSRKELVIIIRQSKVTKPKQKPASKQTSRSPLYLFLTKDINLRRKTGKKAALLRWASYLLIFLGLAGTLYFGWQARKSSSIEPQSTFSVAIPTPAQVTPRTLPHSEPTHLTISSVGIDANVITVGKNADNTIETPPVLSDETGWYKYGPTPGELGPAVIVGHVDSYKGISVFWRLHEVQPGDEIDITRVDGKIVKFKVDALKQFDQANFPTQEVYGNIDYAGLRLITCGGTFNTDTGHYSENTVVYASLAI